MRGFARDLARRARAAGAGWTAGLLIVLAAACGAPAGYGDGNEGAAAGALTERPGGPGSAASAELRSSDPALSGGEVRSPTIDLPLVSVDGRLLTQVTVEGVGTHWFIIDTAAGRSLISADLRRELDVPDSDVRLSLVTGATGQSIMEFVRLPALHVGNAAHETPWVIVADIPDFRRYGEREVNGILGVDVLADYDVVFDVPSGVLRLHPRDGSAEQRLGSATSGVPFHSSVADGFIQFTAVLHGDSVPALLDTGAQTGTMNWRAAALAGVAADSDGVREDARGARGMNGRSMAAHRYTFDSLCIGGRCLPPTELRILDLPVFDAIGGKDAPAVLFGVDVLYDCALLLSYSTKRLHVCV
ncbi:MAG TPA: aspartyl protease family protein [Longimicrobiales bacterium]|nr:aspartyl protease family protein [Longimicrobiales bacterium]